ncbi:hypothetical protein [Niveispirillum cyanobacteriorum]|uniref:hypothetical protein n=1 Tax=Niveispirillum cyanobacteriorum TaxID=1612173 RepID=UPI00131A3B71|nr:hypothetical protein [Niveispirillum cyanobacteriorum]
MSIKFDLGEYLNDVFVETGVGSGGNILKAIRAGYPEIHGIEISETLYHQSHGKIAAEIQKLPRSPSVTLYCGDPVAGLEQLCATMQHKRVTFLLDSYTDGEHLSDADRPIITEISVIRRWFQDNLIQPIIMVGGLRQSAALMTDILNAVLDIDADYQFRVLDDHVSRNVLVALPPTWVQAQ